MSWQPVIGVEVHVQLDTEHKLFCSDRSVFGDEPNTHVCPVCLGLPGALPVVNGEAVRLGVRAALALGCHVMEESTWDRKNYFYPDLPKGYQITQYHRPLAKGGRVHFGGPGGRAEVRIRRVHLEEDAGKLVHDRIPGRTAVDLNRAGTPLVEIVTEPDLGSPEEARTFLAALKQILEYARVSECNMERGALRVDANVSVRRHGNAALGTKTEIKNVNSFSGVERALASEIDRQVATLERGDVVRPETLVWDDDRRVLRSMRSKEESPDYRYFPEPDLLPLRLPGSLVREIGSTLPEPPGRRLERFVTQYELSEHEAGVLTQTRAAADYFEAVASETGDPRAASKWIMGPLQALANDRGLRPGDFPVTPHAASSVIDMVLRGTVSDGAAKTLLTVLADEADDPAELVERLGLRQVTDERRLEAWIDGALAEHPTEAERFAAGEDRLLDFLIGRVMRHSRGSADPRRVRELLRAKLR